MNRQQHPCYISHRTLSTSLHCLAKLLLRTHSTFSKLLTMFVGVSKFGETKLIFVDPGIRLTARMACCWLRSYCCHAWDLCRRVLYLPARQCSWAPSLLEWVTQAFISPDGPDLWLPKVQIWTRLTTEFGEKCSSGSTRRKFMTLINWNSLYCVTVWRMAWSKAWSMTQ